MAEDAADSGENSPIVWEIDDAFAQEALDAFVGWARESGTPKLFYTPDTLIGVDSPHARGVLLDEVYWSTIWVDRGREALEERLLDVLTPTQVVEKSDSTFKSNFYFNFAIENGRAI